MTDTTAAGRRQPTSDRGDERRAALLQALERILHQGVSLEEVNIVDLSRSAGVSRSAFYFYFENKAFAVAALMDEFYTEAAAAGNVLVDTARPAAERIDTAIGILFDTLDRHLPLYRAMAAARGGSSGVQAMWERDRRSFVPAVATMIETERVAGRAPDGPDAALLAATLLDLNDRALEQRAHGNAPSAADHRQTLTTIWLRSIYGTEDR